MHGNRPIWNKWVIGTPEDVPESDECYSNQIQIKYNKGPRFQAEQRHKHIRKIEEYYLVLKGRLVVEVEDKLYDLGRKQILAVPPEHCHMVVRFSNAAEYLVIRAPISRGENKRLCRQNAVEDLQASNP